MAFVKWERTQTRLFGESWVPVVSVEFQRSDRAWRAFVLTIDTGAVVTLLRRSVADALGIDWQSGRQIDLSPVGGSCVRARVFDLSMRLDEQPRVLTAAIADSDSVPNLLGRHSVFPAWRLDFDPLVEGTFVTFPMLNQNVRAMLALFIRGNVVCSRNSGHTPVCAVPPSTARFEHSSTMLARSLLALRLLSAIEPAIRHPLLSGVCWS